MRLSLHSKSEPIPKCVLLENRKWRGIHGFFFAHGQRRQRVMTARTWPELEPIPKVLPKFPR